MENRGPSGKRIAPKTQPPRIAYAERRVKPLAAAPTLRYGPAGDSAPRRRLKASSMAESSLSARPHGPNPPFPS